MIVKINDQTLGTPTVTEEWVRYTVNETDMNQGDNLIYISMQINSIVLKDMQISVTYQDSGNDSGFVGDLNGDCKINFIDLAELANEWLTINSF